MSSNTRNHGIGNFVAKLVEQHQLPSPFTRADVARAARQFFPAADDPKQPWVVASPIDRLVQQGKVLRLGTSRKRHYDYPTAGKLAPISAAVATAKAKLKASPPTQVVHTDALKNALNALVVIENVVNRYTQLEHEHNKLKRAFTEVNERYVSLTLKLADAGVTFRGKWVVIGNAKE